MSCEIFDPACVLDAAKDTVVDTVTGGVENVAENAANSAFDKFIQTMVDAANWVIEQIMTLWLKAPDPDVSSAESPVRWLDAHLAYIVAATVIATMIWSGIRLAIYAKASDAVSLAETLTRTVLASVLTGTLVTVGLALADAWSTWILDEADLNLSLQAFGAGNAVAPGFLLMLALFVLITQFVQLLFMIFRNAIVMVLTSTVTLAAAASGTRMGRQSYEKQISWLIAFILYKPTAALIYALAFEAASSKELWSQLSGLGLMILSVATLPALQRLIAPVTANLGGANAGALAGAAIGAGVALGAMAATGGASAAAGAGSSGAGGFLGNSGSTALASGGGGPQGSPSGATRADATVPAPSGRSASAGGPGGASSSGGGTAPGDLGGEVAGGGPSGADGSGVDAAGSQGGSSSSTQGVVGGDSAAGPSGAPSTGAGDSGPSYSAAPATGGSSGPGGAMGRTLSAGQRGAGGAHRLQSEADGVAGGDGSGGPSGAGRADS